MLNLNLKAKIWLLMLAVGIGVVLSVQWSIRLLQPAARAAGEPLALEVSLIAGVFYAFAVVGLIFYTQWRFFKPLGRLNEAASRLALGDFDFTVAHKSNDEIGRLAVSLQDIADAISQKTALAKGISDGILPQDKAANSDRDMLGCAIDAMIEAIATTNSELISAAGALGQPTLQPRR